MPKKLSFHFTTMTSFSLKTETILGDQYSLKHSSLPCLKCPIRTELYSKGFTLWVEARVVQSDSAGF